MIVSDSFGRPFRHGTTDVAIGVAGMEPLLDLRGTVDRVGYVLRSSRVAIADELAAAADLARGKHDAMPVVVVRGVRVDGRRRGERARDARRARPLPLTAVAGERDLDAILASLDVEREPGVFVVARIADGAELPAGTRASVREREGTTVVLPREDALAAGLPFVFEAAWLTLTVHSAWEAVGLTAAVRGPARRGGHPRERARGLPPRPHPRARRPRRRGDRGDPVAPRVRCTSNPGANTSNAVPRMRRRSLVLASRTVARPVDRSSITRWEGSRG